MAPYREQIKTKYEKIFYPYVPSHIFNSTLYQNRFYIFVYPNRKSISFSRLHGQTLKLGDFLLLKDKKFAKSSQTIYEASGNYEKIYADSPYTNKLIDVTPNNIVGIVQKEDGEDYKILQDMHLRMVRGM